MTLDVIRTLALCATQSKEGHGWEGAKCPVDTHVSRERKETRDCRPRPRRFYPLLNSCKLANNCPITSRKAPLSFPTAFDEANFSREEGLSTCTCFITVESYKMTLDFFMLNLLLLASRFYAHFLKDAISNNRLRKERKAAGCFSCQKMCTYLFWS